jgi:hypothetical protein
VGERKCLTPTLYLENNNNKRKGQTMSVNGNTYQVGDLFTTQRSQVTGKIAEIVPVNARTTRVKLSLDNGTSRWTSVTIK